jgi:hypothetical protein
MSQMDADLIGIHLRSSASSAEKPLKVSQSDFEKAPRPVKI